MYINKQVCEMRSSPHASFVQVTEPEVNVSVDVVGIISLERKPKRFEHDL